MFKPGEFEAIDIPWAQVQKENEQRAYFRWAGGGPEGEGYLYAMEIERSKHKIWMIGLTRSGEAHKMVGSQDYIQDSVVEGQRAEGSH